MKFRVMNNTNSIGIYLVDGAYKNIAPRTTKIVEAVSGIKVKTAGLLIVKIEEK